MAKRKNFSALNVIHNYISSVVKEGDICIDATAGRGNDTAFMAELVGKTGHVYAFDIQQEAIDSTNELLQERGLAERCDVLLKSHSEMDEVVLPNTVSCMTFNFGWLPKSDHSVSTNKETSIIAIKKALELLKVNGVITLIIYYGRDTGFEERDAILEYLPTIDSDKYTVIECPFVNRPNCPPIPILIIRDE